MIRVVLLEPVLPHYRKDVFRMLSDSGRLQMELVAGVEYQKIKSIRPENSKLFNYLSFQILGHRFYYLKGAIKYIKIKNPEIIISTGIDFHLIHTVLIFFFFRIIGRKKFYWWSHATKGNQGKFGIFMRKIIYKKSSGIFSYSMDGEKNLLEMGVQKMKIQVVNNSINIEDYGYMNYSIVSEKSHKLFTVLYSGRLTKDKKVDFLIKALGIIKSKGEFDFKCYIIGDGNINLLMKLANECNVSEEVIFTGEKYGKDNHEYFLKSHIFVCPGGIGLSIVHAFSFGLPVITTNDILKHGPEFELLIPEVNGDIYSDNSVENLAEKIEEWRMKIWEKGRVFANNCITRVKEKEYLPGEQSQKVIDFISEDYNGHN